MPLRVRNAALQPCSKGRRRLLSLVLFQYFSLALLSLSPSLVHIVVVLASFTNRCVYYAHTHTPIQTHQKYAMYVCCFCVCVPARCMNVNRSHSCALEWKLGRGKTSRSMMVVVVVVLANENFTHIHEKGIFSENFQAFYIICEKHSLIIYNFTRSLHKIEPSIKRI